MKPTLISLTALPLASPGPARRNRIEASNMRFRLMYAMLVVAFAAHADELFTSKIEPLLKQRCFKCHSHEKKMKGGLTLDSKSGWVQGGDSGLPTIVVGKPEESLLIKMVRWTDDDHQMPPKEKLPAAEIALLEEWVRLGAHDPRVLVNSPTSTDWWSLKQLVKPALPGVAGATVENPVDRFILARLAEKNLAPSPESDRRTLIRRVLYDLHGLPPSSEELDAFEKDTDPKAYENLVDRLLASQRYGERWARHWLDTIHFAETHGCGHDLPRDHAWRYRDYVIESFNRDTPWPRFIREQLAADRFFHDESRLQAGLGFLSAGVFDHSAFETAPTNFDYLDRDDMVMQTMAAFTSTSPNCARCHAHKFDPISQADYYALQAVFAGVVEGDIPFDENAEIGQQRIRWQSLLTAAKAQDKAVLLNSENEPSVTEWEKRQGPAVKWTTLSYEKLASTDGATLSHSDGVIVSGGTLPAKDTYVITATSSLTRITALRLDVFADKSLPHGGPGRQPENGNLTVTGFEAQVLDPGAAKPVMAKFVRASAEFNQEGWAAPAAIDGNPNTGWGIHPAEGKSHHAVFELAEPLILQAGARLTIWVKQTYGRSHLVGHLALSATDEPPSLAEAIPLLVADARAVAADKRTEPQRLALAAHVLQIRASEELQKLPPQLLVYAAAKKADVLLAVSKGTPKTVAKPKVVQILKRGEFDSPLAVAESGSLSAVDALPARFTKAHAGDESERRAALADWLADEKNPLTWRSIANRVWHYHFGRGICDTPNEFGRMGGVPSHPELLDWLACELRENGGSLKHLHRLILTSTTYRQSSDHRNDAAKLDGENRLLWRMNRLRLDAGSYRDYVLAVADKLDLSFGGPSVRQFITGPPVQLTPTLIYEAYDWSALPKHRRSIYRFVWRGVPDPFMETLDFPDLGLLAPTRNFSASSLQSLALYNNPFVLHFSSELGKQVTTPTDAIRRVLLRDPGADELHDFTAYAQKNGIAALCRVLLNSNEFLFVD